MSNASVSIRDAKHPLQVTFSWPTHFASQVINDHMLNVTLDCPNAFTVTRSIGNSNPRFTNQLLSFFKSVGDREGDWQETQSLSTPDQDFAVTCFESCKGQVSFEFSLDSAFDDPEWTIQLRLEVHRHGLQELIFEFQKFIELVNRT